MFFILAEIILQHVDVRTHFTHIHKDVALPRLQTILFSSDLGGHFEWRTAIGGPALHAAGQVQLCEHLCLGNCFILRGGSEGKENKMLDDSLDSCIDWYVFFFMCAWRHVCFHCHNKNITCGNVRSAIHLCSQLCVYVSTRKCLPQFESTSMYVIMCDCLSMYACNACLCVCVSAPMRVLLCVEYDLRILRLIVAVFHIIDSEQRYRQAKRRQLAAAPASGMGLWYDILCVSAQAINNSDTFLYAWESPWFSLP